MGLGRGTGSPQLFVMMVNIIISSVLDSEMEYRYEEFYVPALFYADDGLSLARSSAEADDLIGVVVEMAERFGLQINVLLYSECGIPPERVRGIPVINNVRNLKTNLGSSRMCYNAFKKGSIVLAEKMANLDLSII